MSTILPKRLIEDFLLMKLLDTTVEVRGELSDWLSFLLFTVEL